MADVLLCPAEDFGSRCDHPGNPTRVWPVHLCEYDDQHDGNHKCICGHEWKEDDE